MLFLPVVNRFIHFILVMLFLAGTYLPAKGNDVLCTGGKIYTDGKKPVKLKKEKVKRVGIFGKMITVMLKGKLSKKLFVQYWTGRGDYYLSTEEMVDIAGEINRIGTRCCTDSSYVTGRDSVRMQRKIINFYFSKNLAHALGYSTVYFKRNELAGFYDDYDFNPKKWGVRPFFHEIKTRFMYFAGKLRGAKPFELFYGTIPK